MIRTIYRIKLQGTHATGRTFERELSYFGQVLEFNERWLAHEKQKELGIEENSRIIAVNKRVPDMLAGEFCEMCGRTSRLAVAQKPDDKLITACGLCRQGLKELREEAKLTPLQRETKAAHEAAGMIEYYNKGEYCEDIRGKDENGLEETCLDRGSNSPCSPCMRRIDNINEEAGD